MDYSFESLGDERFQQLCQALLIASFPNVQCLPVGQRDGGRDAFVPRRRRSASEYFVFQVKFVRHSAHVRDSRDFIEAVVREEKAKIERLRERGCSAYYLLTNVAGSAQLDAGSIDRINALLSEQIGLAAYCWWRDDLARRIDTHPGIKWSYPDILRGVDLLQGLLEGRIGEEETRRRDAIRAYISEQYRTERQVKFKQVELQNNLLDLFVDVPIGIVRSSSHEREWQRVSVAQFAEGNPGSSLSPVAHFRDREVTAVKFLSMSDVRGKLPRIVIEGAPGQGKSTITQFLCQLHPYSFPQSVRGFQLTGISISEL